MNNFIIYPIIYMAIGCLNLIAIKFVDRLRGWDEKPTELQTLSVIFLWPVGWIVGLTFGTYFWLKSKRSKKKLKNEDVCLPLGWGGDCIIKDNGYCGKHSV